MRGVTRVSSLNLGFSCFFVCCRSLRSPFKDLRRLSGLPLRLSYGWFSKLASLSIGPPYSMAPLLRTLKGP